MMPDKEKVYNANEGWWCSSNTSDVSKMLGSREASCSEKNFHGRVVDFLLCNEIMRSDSSA